MAAEMPESIVNKSTTSGPMLKNHLTSINSMIRSIESHLRNVLHYDVVNRFLQNELAYFNMARMELMQQSFTSSTPASSRILAPHHISSTLKRQRQRHISGLNNCSSLLLASDDCRSTPLVRRRGVMNRYEYYGPPLPIDDLWPAGDRLHGPQILRSVSSSSGCSVCCSDMHEHCEAKYAKLEQEISALKSQIAQMFSNRTTGKSAGAPPPAPPLPPPGFLMQRSATSLPLHKRTPKSKLTRISSDSSAMLKNSLSSPGRIDDDARVQMLKVLQDLKAGRATLKTITKSPGGTPRKRALVVFQNTKTCQDLLAEALKSKFANVHRLQRINNMSNSENFSDNDDSMDAQSFEDDSWTDTSTNIIMESPNTSRARIHTIS